jgi:TRAP-type mannitol/chloroaromatic compound transport system substrate-binding protein
MRRIGVNTVLTPPGEIFTALQSGVVDAAEFVGPWNDLALGLYQIAPYYYLPAFHEPSAGLECIVSLDFYENLSPWLREVVRSAADATADETSADFRYHNAIVLKDLIGRGAVVSAFPADVTSALGAAAREVIAAYPQGDPMSEKIHGPYFEFVKSCAAYGAAVEGRSYAERASVWGI